MTAEPLTAEEERRLRIDLSTPASDVTRVSARTVRQLLATLDAERAATEALRKRLRSALTSEDEIAHGEAWESGRGGLGECAYDDEPWPCRTQRGIDRALAALGQQEPGS